MTEQIATHTPPVRRASLPPQQPQARPALQQQNRYVSPQYHRNMPTTTSPGADDLPDEDAIYAPVYSPRSAIRYTTTDDEQIIQRGNQRIVIHHTPPPQSQQPQQSQPARKQYHVLFWLGIMLCLMLIGWVVLSLVSGFLQQKWDDLRYGTTRTYQVDINVGHDGRVSHFIAINLGGYIEVIETQRAHPEASHIYVPSNLVVPASDPITLTFADLTGNGKLDMIIATPTVTAIMYNTGSVFQSQPPGK